MLLSTFEKGIWDLKVPLKDSLQVSRGEKVNFCSALEERYDSDWELKLGEFATMAKLTQEIFNQI